MVTASVAIAVLGALTFIAIAVASVAIWRARAAQGALRANEVKHGERVELDRKRVELDRKIEADGRLAGDIAHDLTDLLTAITGHTELLIASLDPSGTSILDAYEIRRAALRTAQLTKRLRTLSGAQGPIYTIDLPTPEPPAAPEPAAVVPRVAVPVLVVEDEPGVRELIRVVLVRAGHEVVAVAGPHAALAVLRRQPAISLMLVDVVMPEMDGYDLVAEARTISTDVHAVFMSAFARDARRHSSSDGFLAKPFTAEALTATVKQALAASA